MFACSTPDTHETLRLYSSESLIGPWCEHPASPIVRGDASRARPAGRPVRDGSGWLRFAQDCTSAYGRRVRAFRILELTPERYAEEEHGLGESLAPVGAGWNGQRIHHVDAHRLRTGRWIACVDGAAEERSRE
jgi:hypothetical protein